MTPIQNEVRELTPMCLKVRELTLIQNKARELTLGEIKVTEQTPLYTGDTQGPKATTDRYFERSHKGNFKSPNADTVPITNSHISDTASNSRKSLTADTDFNTNNNPINGLSTCEPKTLPLAHNSKQSLLLDTDYSKSPHTKSCYFTI